MESFIKDNGINKYVISNPVKVRPNIVDLTFFRGLNVRQQLLAKKGDVLGLEREIQAKLDTITDKINSNDFIAIKSNVNNLRNLIRALDKPVPTDFSTFDELTPEEQQKLPPNDVNFMVIQDLKTDEEQLLINKGEEALKKDLLVLKEKIHNLLMGCRFNDISDQMINEFRNLIRVLCIENR